MTSKTPTPEAFRQALEFSATPVILTDENLIVTFVNEATRAMLRQHAAAFAKAFPGFRPDRILGTCIDAFHKDPSHQRRMLADPSIFPHRAEIAVGGLHFSLNVSRSTDDEGNVTGFALQWSDVTPRVRYAEEASRVVQALRDGDLTVRGDEAAMSDEFRPMLQSINLAVEATVEPIVATMGVIGRVAVGEPADLIEADYKGTFAELRDSVNALVQATAQITDVATRIADGDLTVQVAQRSKDDRLMGAMSRMLEDLNALMRQIRAASQQLDGGSKQVNEASETLASNAARSAASLQEVSASMTEISVQTGENAKNATSALDLSTRARESANVGDQQMDSMVKAMKDIDESARSISKIIKVIDDIAFQTNLLALNAAVEAGRAGVHGRGFAVVAEEVRRLAARSAQAAKETTDMIEGSSRLVNQGIDIADATAKSLSAIVSSVSEVSDLVGEIAAASQEQAHGIKEVNQSLGMVDSATQQNTAKAEEMAAASKELSSHSANLSARLERFQLADGQGQRPSRPGPSRSRGPAQRPAQGAQRPAPRRPAAVGPSRTSRSSSAPRPPSASRPSGPSRPAGPSRPSRSGARGLTLDDQDFGDF
ncbi:MAG: hypothetical protein KTR31_15155 [Myxococcales bacterium]|nr:hypothetical protein [Myxococcales bacterium]